MCFSSEASFIASAVLCVTGVVTIKKIKNKSQLLFASIPLLFSIQQFSEGFVWVSKVNIKYAYFEYPAIYIFLVFALVIWPIIVPISITLIEPNVKRKKVLKYLSAMGILLSFYMIYTLLFCNISAQITSFHIHYQIEYPLMFMKFKGLFYFIPIVVSIFISSIRRMNIFGFVLVFSYVFTFVFFHEYITSVWCFFAAILSGLILFIIIESNKENKLQSIKIKM